MTKEQLLQERAKVIDHWPGMEKYQVGVGDIFTLNQMVWMGDTDTVREFVQTYPKLFQLLEWWEDRPTEDLPKYLCSVLNKQFVERVNYYMLDTKNVLLDTHITPLPLKFFVPATEQEYLNVKPTLRRWAKKNHE
jgi:hypothetical protein